MPPRDCDENRGPETELGAMDVEDKGGGMLAGAALAKDTFGILDDG